jgi:urease accessory protein
MIAPMITIAQTFLGNALKDVALQQRVEHARKMGECLEVELTQNDSLKSRIRAKSPDGTTVGIIKARGWNVAEGDVFETESKQVVVVRLQAQEVMVLRVASECSGYGIELVHLGHVLGNHHYPITISPDCIYVQLVADKTVIAAAIENFKIPGLAITYESRSFEHLSFQPHSHNQPSSHPHPHP